MGHQEDCHARAAVFGVIRIRLRRGASAKHEQGQRQQDAAQAGADYYFTKPFSPRTLLDYIYAVLLG